MRLQIVKVGAVAVYLRADVMACAVREIFTESRVANYLPCRIVGLPASERGSMGESILHQADGGIASLAHGVKDVMLALAGLAAHDAGPGDVVVAGAGRLLTGPDIN